jgi:hypothetical protein
VARLGERLGRLSRGAVDVPCPAIPTIRGLALRSVIGQQKPSNCSNLETSASEMSRPSCNSHFCWERSARHTLWVKRLRASSSTFGMRECPALCGCASRFAAEDLIKNVRGWPGRPREELKKAPAGGPTKVQPR